MDRTIWTCEEGSKDTVYEYFVSATKKDWSHWSCKIPMWTYPDVDPVPFYQLVIPTLDSVRCVGSHSLSCSITQLVFETLV